MKLVKIIFILLAISLNSCEEEIDLDLNEAEPKLVIEASINIEEDGSNFAFIKLTTTTPFFNTDIPFVADATVTITDENGIQYPFSQWLLPWRFNSTS